MVTIFSSDHMTGANREYPGGVRATTAMHAGISFISGHLLVIGIA